jgi:hypothetical protein
MPIIDIHTHCAPRVAGDPFGVAAVMRGTPVGRNAVTNFAACRRSRIMRCPRKSSGATRRDFSILMSGD